MFDTTNAELLGEKIFLYKNFLSAEEIFEYNLIINSLSEKDWSPADWSLDPEVNLMFYSKPIKKILDLREKISNLLPKELFLGEGDFFIKLLKNATWGEHSDGENYEDVINFFNEDPDKELVEMSAPVYGLIVYFNEFDGGEIYYPRQKIEYKPDAGDLIIHSAGKECSHEVKAVKSKSRYSFSANIRKNFMVTEEMKGIKRV